MAKVISRGKAVIDGKEVNLSDFDDTRYSTPVLKKKQAPPIALAPGRLRGK
jgi:hypothetical protein